MKGREVENMADITRQEAAHLLRRTGFGNRIEDIKSLSARSRNKAVDQIIDYGRVNNQEMEDRLTANFEFLRASSPDSINDQNFNDAEIRAWWIFRMLLTHRPFEEKMTLFWHNFFATSLDKVPAIHIYTQNLDLRSHALGRFDDLLLKISQGAAMLIWLDGINSTRTNPNENFGRELQELFSTGINDAVTGEANYTEEDVKEVSRAFTGWRLRKSADPSPFAYEWYLDENEADHGQKTIYGQTANFSGQDVITVLADRRTTARFLVKRLFEFFVYRLDTESDEDRATIDKFADVYFANDHSIRELVRAIFKSEEFFSPRARFALIKNPVEFLIGSMRMLEASVGFGSTGARPAILETSLRTMGMDLFSPPDVFGWKLNDGFVTTDAMLVRFNIADRLMYFLGGGRFVKSSAKKTVKKMLDSFGLLEIDSAVEKRLQDYLALNSAGVPVGWNSSDISAIGKIKNLGRLIMCLPEHHLN